LIQGFFWEKLAAMDDATAARLLRRSYFPGNGERCKRAGLMWWR
jgi:hypothetical protein